MNQAPVHIADFSPVKFALHYMARDCACLVVGRECGVKLKTRKFDHIRKP